MPRHTRLSDFLWNDVEQGSLAASVAATLNTLASAGAALAEIIAQGPFQDSHRAISKSDGHGDAQKGLDVIADEHFIAALKPAPVALLASEEQAEPIILDPAYDLAVAMDPLDGSGNIGNGAPIGTIFSILPYDSQRHPTPAAAFLRPGHEQIAAGYILYGPSLMMVLTYGLGTHVFAYDRPLKCFRHAAVARVPPRTNSYAINTSNARHWESGIVRYVQDCVHGTDGPRHQDTNTRWLGAMVGEAHRILLEGGVYLYPGDARPAYQRGRLRLVYEANPVGFLMEQAGAAATDGTRRMLDITPASLHQKVPLVFGSRDEVARIGDYINDRDPRNSPLFRNRSLFEDNASASGHA